MIKISCEGATSLEVLSHIKGFAALISAQVPAKTGTMPEDIVTHAAASAHAPEVAAAPAQNVTAMPSAVLTPPTPSPVPVATAPAPMPIAPAPAPQQAPPIIQMTPTPAAVPTAAPAPVPAAVPVATAPGYTLDQLGRAGSALVDAGKRDQLIALLQRRGIQTLSQLDPTQYGAFATELRGLGAQI